MNALLQNTQLLYKLLIGVFVALVLVIAVLAYFAFQQDRTNDLGFDSITINSDATPLTVPDYAEWMRDALNIQISSDSGVQTLVRGEATYGDAKNRLQTLLDQWRTRRPPPELLAHYTNEKNRLVAHLAVFEDSQSDNLIVNKSEYALEIAERMYLIDRRYNEKRKELANNIPEEILKELYELGYYIY